MSYIPGLHIIANFRSEAYALLDHYRATEQLFDEHIRQAGLTKIGQVYHRFPDGGFTGVVCLAESHISIHTWPEHGRVTFDVFLSNYQRVNDGTTRRIYEAVLALFGASELVVHELKR